MRILYRALPLPLVLLLSVQLLAVSARLDQSDADLPSSQLLSRADAYLATGRGSDALELYDIVAGRDKSSYLNIYKRGTAHLALGHVKKALDDFEAVLALTEFDQARLQAARIQLRLGDYGTAAESIKTYLSRNKQDPTALELQKQVARAALSQQKAERAKQKKNWDQCIEAATEAIQAANANLALLELRANCNARLDRVEEAVGDLSRAVSISPNTPHLLTELTILQALYLDTGSSSLTPIKQCLHFDPDSKACKKLFRSLKSLEKDLSKTRNFIEASSWRLALKILDPKSTSGGKDKSLIDRVKDMLAEYTREPVATEMVNDGLKFDLPTQKASQLLTTLYAWTCKAYTNLPSTRLAKPFCSELLARDPEHADGILGMAEASLKDENYEEAVRLFNKAFENSGQSDRAILDKLQKAQRLLKQSKSKDYYKVLDVPRDADTKTIKKAYRRATLKAHPDKGGSEAAMAAVNEAYEVLSNPELRARFDNGDDPNDPASGQGGGPNGRGGFHPFYGSPGGGGAGGEQFFNQFFQGQGGFGGSQNYKQSFKFHFG